MSKRPWQHTLELELNDDKIKTVEYDVELILSKVIVSKRPRRADPTNMTTNTNTDVFPVKHKTSTNIFVNKRPLGLTETLLRRPLDDNAMPPPLADTNIDDIKDKNVFVNDFVNDIANDFVNTRLRPNSGGGGAP